MKKRRFVLRVAVVITLFIIIVTYFTPKPLKNIFIMEDIKSDGLVYITVFDVLNQTSKNMTGQVIDLLGEDSDMFGPLLYNVSISGPIFYKNVSVNADLVNLYISLPLQDGNYCKRTIELILSSGAEEEGFAFVNVENRGYIVTDGKEIISKFVQNIRM